MDINGTPAAALMLRQGGETKFNLATLKKDNQTDAQVATLASQIPPPAPPSSASLNAQRGHTVNTTA